VERGLKQADNRATRRARLVGPWSAKLPKEAASNWIAEANERSRGGEVRPASLSEEPAIVSAANGENEKTS